MGVSLSKRWQRISEQTDPGLKKVLIGLGWEARSTDGADFDLDASAFLLAETGKVRGDDDFIFLQ